MVHRVLCHLPLFLKPAVLVCACAFAEFTCAHRFVCKEATVQNGQPLAFKTCEVGFQSPREPFCVLSGFIVCRHTH